MRFYISVWGEIDGGGLLDFCCNYKQHEHMDYGLYEGNYSTGDVGDLHVCILKDSMSIHKKSQMGFAHRL